MFFLCIHQSLPSFQHQERTIRVQFAIRISCTENTRSSTQDGVPFKNFGAISKYDTRAPSLVISMLGMRRFYTLISLHFESILFLFK